MNGETYSYDEVRAAAWRYLNSGRFVLYPGFYVDLVDKGECDMAAGWLADEIVAVIAEAQSAKPIKPERCGF